MKTEMRFVAFGGQGIVLAGVILGEAAIADSNNAVQTQSYGPESRGGAAKSEVIISNDDIDYPMVVEADCLVALSQPGYDKYAAEVKPGGTLIVDQDLVDAGTPPEGRAFYSLPFAKTADRLGNRIVTNIVVLGSVCSITGVVSENNLAAAVESNVPEKFRELNQTAFSEGFKLGAEAVKLKAAGEK
ncbi:MAG: 2-oxoacid:acceptor oxidoreductase family protein [Candidatus Zixiibacteriota bacterium]|nr:MAG: 2-oxoacid:acceptor oxidoreductase family protein [candidate division Zixibacteria bacterium]